LGPADGDDDGGGAIVPETLFFSAGSSESGYKEASVFVHDISQRDGLDDASASGRGGFFLTPKQILLALVIPTTWGLGFALAKVGMDQFPPLLLMSMRFALAALVLIWFAKPPWGFMWRIFGIAAISATIQYGFTFYGLKGIDASTAVIVVQLEAPFMALLAAVFLKDRLGWKRTIGMVLAFGGVAVIAGEPRLEDNLIYVGLVAIGAMTWAVGQVMVSQLREVRGPTLLAWVATFAAPQMFVASLLFESDQLQAVTQATWADWGIVLYLALVMTALAYSIWYNLLSTCALSSLSPFLLLTPVTTVLFGVLILDEVFTLPMTIGAVMVLAGVAATTINRRPRVDAVDKTVSEP